MQGPGLGDQRWLENPPSWRFRARKIIKQMEVSMEKCGKKHLLMEV